MKSFNVHGKHSTLIGLCLLVVLGLAVYANSLKGEFLLDDVNLIKDNPDIRSFAHIGKIFSRSVIGPSGEMYGYYRPLRTFLFMLEYSLWGLDVRGYHLVNILLHIAVALVLFWFITLLFNDRLLSFLASLFFLLHPVQVEVVSFISDCDNSLSLLFALLSFIFYIRAVHGKRLADQALMLFSFLLGLLAKENILILPLAVLVYHWAFGQRIKPRLFLSLVSLAAAYIVLRLTLLRSALVYVPSLSQMFEAVPGFFVAVGKYLQILIFPFGLHVQAQEPLFRFTDPRAIAGAVIVLLYLFWGFKVKRSNRLVFFSIFWFFIWLIPHSNIYPIGPYLSERWLYVPSVGFFVILARGLSFSLKDKRFQVLGAILVVGLSGFYSYLTVSQNRYWREAVTFYKRAVEFSPENYIVYEQLGLAYEKEGRYQEALIAYQEGIDLKPDHASFYNNLGNLYCAMDHTQDAIDAYNRALEKDPGFAQAYYNLGNMYYRSADVDEAIIAYRKALELDPGYAKAYNNLGFVYYGLGRTEEALENYKKAIEADPYLGEAHNNLAVLYFYQEEIALSLKHCREALRLGYPVNPEFLKMIEPYKPGR